MTGSRVAAALLLLGVSACGSNARQTDGAASDGAADAATAGAGGASGGIGGAGGSGGRGGSVAGAAGTGVTGVAGTGVAGAGVAGRGGSSTGSGGGAAGRGGTGGAAGRGGTGGAAGRGGTGGFPDRCPGIDFTPAPVVPLLHSDQPAPAPIGGTLASGTYHVTQLVNYGGTPTGITTCNTFVEGIMEIAAASATEGTVHDNVGLANLGGTPHLYSYQTSGTTLMLRAQCDFAQTLTWQYTATPTQLIYIQPPGDTTCWLGTTLVWTWTKQ